MPALTFKAENAIMLAFFAWGYYALERKVRYKMATSSITANFAIRDEKEAKAFISALLSESRSMVPPARKRNWKLVGSVREIEEVSHA